MLRIAVLICCVQITLLRAVQAETPADGSTGFRYTLKSAIQEDAEKYLVEKVNFRTFHEKFGINSIYWGVNENDIPAKLTFHFPLEKPLRSATLHTNVTTCNFGQNSNLGMGKSSGSVWLSSDGKSWQKILDVPSPTDKLVYPTELHVIIPVEFKGKQNLWIQFRMIASGMTDSSYSTAQVGRNAEKAENDNVFDLRVRY